MASCSSRRAHEEQLTFEDGRLKVAGREARAGFGFRGVSGERVGYACGDRLEEDAIRAAIATVQAVAGGHAGRENVAPAPPGPALYGAATRSRPPTAPASSPCSSGSRPIAGRRSRQW